MKRILFFLLCPLFCYAEFSASDSASLSSIDESVDSINADVYGILDSLTAMRNLQIAPIKTDVHNIASYVETIMNRLPDSSSTNDFVNYSTYLSKATDLQLRFFNDNWDFQNVNPDLTSWRNSIRLLNFNGDKSVVDCLQMIVSQLSNQSAGYSQFATQNSIILADTRNAITNLIYKTLQGIQYQIASVPVNADLSTVPSTSAHTYLPSGPYDIPTLLRHLVASIGWNFQQKSQYDRDFVLQLQDIRRLLGSISFTNDVTLAVTNIVELPFDTSWRGLQEAFDIGRLWSESAITPDKDGDVIQQTYLSHYDDLSTDFFEAVPELILMGVRQRKSVNTTLFNVLTNIQIHTTFLRSIDHNVGIIASNFNYQTQVQDNSADVRGNITEAQSTLRIAWQNNELPSYLELDWWGDNIQPAQLPEEVILDFSDIVHDINWGFFKFENMSPNDFVLTADISPYRSFFAFVRGIFIFFYVCIAISLAACIFFLCCKLFMFISTIISTNSL